MDLINLIKRNKALKNLVHWSITSARNPRPRLWVRILVNPCVHKKAKGAKIRRRTRMDVFPWNSFELGKNATIEDFCTVNNGSGDVIIADRVRIGIGSVLIGPVRMGKGSGLGQHVFISGFNHGYLDGNTNSSDQPLDIKPTEIGEAAHVGANSVILAGVTIGKHCQIGAGSVVTKDIPPYSVAVGNPARVIKKFNFESQTWNRVL